jgi:PAS domain S-box-containing protein
VIRDEAGRAVGIFGVFTDVTVQRRIEQQLHEQHLRHEITLQSIGDAVITTDAAGSIVLMNSVAEAYTGVSAAEATGLPVGAVLRLLDEVTRESRESSLLEVLRGRDPGLPAGRRLAIPGGGERLVVETVGLIRPRGATPAGAVLVVRDVTRERQRSDEEARSSRLESLGLLAGGMAGNLTLAQSVPGLPEAALPRLAGVERAIWRAVRVTKQLTTFAKGGQPVKQRTDLARLLREATDYAVANTAVTVRYELAPDLAEVEADEGQMVQVFNNLAVNAVQAMPKGGLLAVNAGPAPGPGGPGAAGGGGGWVRITFSDTGSGIAPRHLEKIFDPFFTTKERGTGFGLSTSYAVVRQHGGRISVKSEPGRGTRFEILLPSLPPAGVVPAAG